MTTALGPAGSRASAEAFVEGVAAVRRSLLAAARADDALVDIANLAVRRLGASVAGTWVGTSRSWVPSTGGDAEVLQRHRGVDLLRGAVSVPLVVRGRDLGAFVAVFSGSFDLGTCAAAEELAEYAAMALLLTRNGLGPAEAAPQSALAPQPSAAPRPAAPVPPAVAPVPVGLGEGAASARGSATSVSPVDAVADVPAGRAAGDAKFLGDLRSAVMSERIHPHFQPVVRFADGAVLAFEALARWHDEERGWVPPGTFIPLAEQHGLIASLGMRVMADSARQAAEWAGAPGGGDVSIIINLSPVQLQSRSLVTEIGNLVRRHRVGAGRLVLELAGEGSFDTARTAGLLERFEGAGVHIAVGDPESLQHVRSSSLAIAADFIKIPRRLVGNVVGSVLARQEIDRLVQAARGAGVYTVAEGVENREELAALRKLGVEAGLGFLWSPAVPAQEATKFLAAPPWR